MRHGRGIDERTAGRLLARATYVNGDADDPSTSNLQP